MGDVISSLLFQPPNPPTPMRMRSSSYCSHMELIWMVTSKASRIPALYIHRKYAVFTILYSHGNAEDLGMLIDYLLDMSKILHVNIIAYDYTGYGFSNRTSTSDNNGNSPIAPSEEHCYADITAVYEFLVEERGVEPCRIIIYGRSVGSGPSCYLAQKLNRKSVMENITTSGCDAFRASAILPINYLASYTCGASNQHVLHPVAEYIENIQIGRSSSFRENYIGGVILHSPFTSIYRIVVDLGFTIQGDVFCNINRVQDIRCPVLIIHGTNDEIVPFTHGESLHAALPASCKVFAPFWAKGMGHNNIEVDATNSFVRSLMQFLQFVRARETQPDKSCPQVTPPGRVMMRLTKEYVHEHVICMMDKEKKQIDGFLMKHKRNSIKSKLSKDKKGIATVRSENVSRGHFEVEDRSIRNGFQPSPHISRQTWSQKKCQEHSQRMTNPINPPDFVAESRSPYNATRELSNGE